MIALAGRRPDAPGAARRFPPEAVPRVRAALRRLLEDTAAKGLVASAAAGADLLAHEAAVDVGVPRTAVLPFAVDRFRETSVRDRSGPWECLYERLVARRPADLTLVEMPDPGDDPYVAANLEILDRARGLAGPEGRVIAVLVWNGAAHGPHDATAQFGQAARTMGLAVREVLTSD